MEQAGSYAQSGRRALAGVLLLGLVAEPAFCQALTASADRPGSIAGRVLRPDGIPQPDAEVVTAVRRQGRLRLLSWRGRTASDGRYQIPGVPPGEYLVLVRQVGGDVPVDGRPHATLFPGVAPTEPGSTVRVFAGVPVEGIDVWLLPAPRRFTVDGRIVDPENRPLENVVVEFGRPLTRATDVWTVTDPGGLFTLERVAPGPLVMRARAESPDGVLSGVASTELALESVQDVRIVLGKPGRVTGTVVAGAAPLPASLRLALVPTLLRPSALYPEEEAAPTRDGIFEVRGAEGEQSLAVRGLPPGWTVKQVTRRGAPLPGARLWLAGGSVVDGLRVEVGPASTGRGQDGRRTPAP